MAAQDDLGEASSHEREILMYIKGSPEMSQVNLFARL